jgi:hypothetical protein
MNLESQLIGKVNFKVYINLKFIDLGLTDYPEIIKRPMDLASVRKSLAKGKYKKYEDFFKDIQLIWDNCKQYNI